MSRRWLLPPILLALQLLVLSSLTLLQLLGPELTPTLSRLSCRSSGQSYVWSQVVSFSVIQHCPVHLYSHLALPHSTV